MISTNKSNVFIIYTIGNDLTMKLCSCFEYIRIYFRLLLEISPPFIIIFNICDVLLLYIQLSYNSYEGNMCESV